MGCPSPGVRQWEDEPPWLLEGLVRLQEGCGKLDAAPEECMNAHQLPKQGRKGRLKPLCDRLTGFLQLPRWTPQTELSECSSTVGLTSQLHTGMWVATTEEESRLWGDVAAKTLSGKWKERSEPLLAIAQVAHQRQSGSLMVARPDPHQIPTSGAEGAGAGREKSTHS